MSVINTTLHGIHVAAINAGSLLVFETDVEFNEDKVSPGPEGFIATAVFALAVLVLGFLLVRRIRRSHFRAEARESIAAELAEGSAEGSAVDSAEGNAGTDPVDPTNPSGSADESGPSGPANS